MEPTEAHRAEARDIAANYRSVLASSDAEDLACEIAQAISDAETRGANQNELAREIVSEVIVDERVTRLRTALIAAGRAAGGALADNCSDDFLVHVAEEVKGRIRELTENGVSVHKAYAKGREEALIEAIELVTAYANTETTLTERERAAVRFVAHRLKGRVPVRLAGSGAPEADDHGE